MRDTFIARLSSLAASNKRLHLITGDLGFGVLTEFSKKYPDQFLNAGVAEQNMTGLATGLALEGRIVFTYSIANFPILRCLEQIRNDAAYHEANVNVVSIGGGFSYGALGMSHHATEDLAIMRALPQVTVFSPSCLWEVERVTEAAVQTEGVCYIRLDKSHAGRTDSACADFEVGLPRRIAHGENLTLVATGGILEEVLSANEFLREHGISTDIFSVHTLKPANLQPITESIAKTRRVLVVEEHVVEGGLAGLVAESCFYSGVSAEASHRVGLTGGYTSVVGSQKYLRSKYGMSAEALGGTALALVRGNDG